MSCLDVRSGTNYVGAHTVSVSLPTPQTCLPAQQQILFHYNSPPRYHTELFSKELQKKNKTCVSPPAPQIHKVIKVPGGWYACRIMERQKEGKTLSVIFSPVSFFSLVRKLNLEVEWDIIQTSLHRGEKHDSTQSRCLNYIRQHLTSSLPATPILTSQLHHVSRGGKGPLLLFTPRLWVKQHLTADPSAKCEPRWFWNKSCRLCLQKKGEADGLWN